MGIALSACQSLRGEPGTGTADAGWRVLERLGDARFRPPHAGSWTPAIAGSRVPAASRVTTGNGGRVILAAPGAQISATPGSEFTLPADGPNGRIEHENGRLRIRVAAADAAPLAVRTPFLGVLASGSAFEVLVSATATEVTVESGELRVVTPDGERQTSLVAGQSVYAAHPHGEELAVHLPRGRALEPAVVPAIRPRPDSPLEPARRVPGVDAVPGPALPGAATRHHPGVAARSAPSVSVAAKADVPAGTAAAPRQFTVDDAGDEAEDTTPAAERPATPYDRLTGGMLRGLPATPPIPVRRPAPSSAPSSD